MRRVILGTAGHIDHGKTALVRALTGTDTDRLPEEKRRGITIDLGFALLETGDVALAIVDVPGHEAFVRNMLAGASGIDLALLVIAADEGVMPQTREHLAIIQLLGIERGVVALTKVDLVDEDWLDLVRDDVADLVAGTSLATAPVIGVSSRSGHGLETLRQALVDAAAATPERTRADLFRMPIDRVFTVRGTGTVVTGTVWSGTLRRDDQVHIEPADFRARVRGLQQHGRDTDEVTAGARAAVALTGVERQALQRGDTLVVGAGWKAASMLTVDLRVLDDAAAPIRPRQRVRLHIGTAEVMARVALLTAAVEPGERAVAQLRLEAPVIARAGDRFVIRSYSPVRTIAGGTVLEPAPPKRKRLAAHERHALGQLLMPATALAGAVALAGAAGVDAAELPVLTGLDEDSVRSQIAADATLLVSGHRVLAAGPLAACRNAVRTRIAAFHAESPLEDGIDRDALRRTVDVAFRPLLDTAIGGLVAERELALVGNAIALAAHRPVPAPAQAAPLQLLLDVHSQAALQPPDLDTLPPGLGNRPDILLLLRHLEREGHLVRVSPSRWCDRAAIDAAVLALHSGLQLSTPHPVAAYRDILGVTRKHLIPLLEFFDRTGVTRRIGDARELVMDSRLTAR